ncbi:MAG: HAMP domain-containing protein [Sphingomonadaceae bacterium]|nr:HAMP domain-containing protein [Sphingomonadaceae bacterium]MCP5392453.1 HAMP domain-containing protein [Sphingomonadaceae bacterium]
MRVWPRSLRGQVLLAATLALLLAQGISALLLYRAAENRRDGVMLNAAAFQLIRQPDERISDRFEEAKRERRNRGEPRMPPPPDLPRMPRPLRLEWVGTPSQLPGDRRDSDREKELRSLLAAQGVPIGEVMVFERAVAADPYISANPRIQRRILRDGLQDRQLLVAALRREDATSWAVARVPEPRIQSGVRRTIVFQTLVIFLVLVTSLFFLLRRITRPLATLTERTERFAATRQAGDPLPAEGPDDIQRLIVAHNAMEARIAALIDEKDVMLGAIGHDLKTPLTALRVRIESVEDEAERAKMAAGIEDITRSLDDILSLARVGKNDDQAEPTDLAALTASVVEEFEDMGEPVTLADTSRLVLPVHVTWLRRALRNLISNALRYGNEARVTLTDDGEAVILGVEDSGPGIPEDRIADMLEPFTRGEASRNRATGGAGLGLTLARAIAEQHAGQLILSNLPEGGLRAEIRLPRG